MIAKKFFASVLVGICSVAAFADFNRAGFADSAEIRRTVAGTWFTCPVEMLASKSSSFLENRVGEVFQIRMEEKADCYQVIVAPQSEIDIDMVSNGSHKMMRAAVYPEGGQGSWVLSRDKKTGKPQKIVWYFSPDSDVFLQLRPSGEKTYADLVVCGSYAAKSVPVGISFSQAYSVSFQEIKKLTSKSLPWNKVEFETGLYRDSLQMVGVIRENLHTFEYNEDACYDERGILRSVISGQTFTLEDELGNEYVPNIEKRHILSGAGFLKWIVDGLIEPLTGRGAKINDLTEPTVDINALGKNGVMLQQWNITFTLDWVRNLAAAAYSVRNNRNLDFKSAGIDVNRNYFVADLVDGKLVNSSGYIKDTGYSTDRLKSILYVLGATEPSWFYLAAIRQGSNVRHDELVFNNCAVLFPYFDDAGKFGCFVFSQGRELKLEDFLEAYSSSYVHLERVKSSETFFPYSKK